MSRPSLIRPDQPAPLRALLHVYQFAASLKLAVVLILSSAFTFAVGTFVEARYGIAVSQFGVYQTWWFNLLMVLLATNIFCAAAIRYPWKRHQTGFVITHIGLLTLLFGTALSRIYGIDAQILVWENQASGWALQDDSMHLSLVVHKETTASDAELRRIPGDVQQDEHLQRLPRIEFHPGPFSWQDYDEAFPLTRLSTDAVNESPKWKFWSGLYPFRYVTGKMFNTARWGSTRAGDVLYDDDGVKLEVLDYYADSRQVSAPRISIAVSMPRSSRMDANGKPVKSRYRWRMDDLSVNKLANPSDEFPHGASTTKALFPGGTVALMMTDDPLRLKAFQANKPVGELGEKGQVVLLIDGKPRRFSVADKQDAGKFKIEGTDWQAEVADYWPAGRLGFDQENEQYRVSPPPGVDGSVNPVVEVTLYKKDKEAGRLVLFADQPNLSIQSHENHIYGDYWFDHKDKDRNQRMQHGIGNRIDVLQVHDDGKFQLYYRRWDKDSIVAAGKLDPNGTPESAMDAFSMADQLKFFVHEYVPADEPKDITLPVAFEKGKTLGTRRPAAKLRLTVDNKTEEFWVEAYKGDPDFSPRTTLAHPIIAGKDRKVAITMPIDAVDIGFRVRLLDFERRLDPGTSQPSHYSSTIDILARNFDRKIMAANFDGTAAEQVEFPLVLAHDHAFTADSAQITDDGKYLYWLVGERSTIQRIKLGDETAIPETVVGGPSIPLQPVAFAIDGDTLFWAEYTSTRSGFQARIRRAELDGSNETTLAAIPVKPTGLALDTASETVFWTCRKEVARGEAAVGGMGRVNYEGNEQQDDLVTRNIGVPSSLAVDGIGGRIYWTEPDRGIIRNAKLDGTDIRKISLTGDQVPDSIAVDGQSERIFWTDLREAEEASEIEKPTQSDHRHRIWSAGLDGDDAEVFADVRIDNPTGLKITAAGDRVIWTQEAILKHNVWITMNAPIEFANPFTSQSYRLFQESFDGPYEPGTTEYQTFALKDVDTEDIYLSVLTVNHDPGRFIRNSGCLVVVLGIVTMFYMRAYFFKRPDEDEVRARRAANRTRNVPSENGQERSHRKNVEVVDAEVVQ